MKENRKVVPVNKYNFVRFYPQSTALSQSKYAKEVHNGLLYRWRNIFDPLPILKGDILKIHTNFDDAVLVAGDVFKVIEGTNTIITGGTNYTISYVPIGSTNNYIITLTIPSSSVKTNGQSIRIGIVNGSTIKYTSNCFEVYDYTEKNIRGTHVLSFRHDNDIYNYNWTETDTTDLYTVRVPSNLASISYPSDDSVYKSSTTGRPRKTRSVIDKSLQFETYYASEDLHDAFNMSIHLKDFYVNGNKMVKDGAYELSYSRTFNLSKGTVNLLDTRYSIRVDRCSDELPPPPPPPPPPPVDDPVINYLLVEQSGSPSVYIDGNLRLIIDEVVVLEVFGNLDAGTISVSDGDVVTAFAFFIANSIDPGLTNPTLRLVIEEDSVVIVDESVLIADPTQSYSITEVFTANGDSVYDITVTTFEA
jgi:hypothetical protein